MGLAFLLLELSATHLKDLDLDLLFLLSVDLDLVFGGHDLLL